MPLIIDTGISDHKSWHDVSNSACMVSAPSPDNENIALLAVADGAGGADEDESAASRAVRIMQDSFLTAPNDWSTDQALRESIKVVNNALYTAGRNGGASSLSGLVLDNSRWILGHVGSTRVWLLRDQKLKLLTGNHVSALSAGDGGTTLGCGASKTIDIAVTSGELQQDDIFLLTTDDVYNALDGILILGSLIEDKPVQRITDDITKQTLERGKKNNVSACAVRINTVGSSSEPDTAEAAIDVPLGPLPHTGDTVDNFHILGALYKDHVSVTYKAVDRESTDTVFLKFPDPRLAVSHGFQELYLREEWVGKRLDNSYLVKVLPLKPKDRSQLYCVLGYHKGTSLSKRIRHKGSLSIKESLYFIKQLLDCVQYLHSKGIIHKDIKAGNILVDKENKRLILTSFGQCTMDHIRANGGRPPSPANRNYTAPEHLEEGQTDKRADIYSVGAILYKMLTGNYPYGRITSASDFLHRDFIPPENYNSEIPEWLSGVLRKACAVQPQARFRDAAAFTREINNH